MIKIGGIQKVSLIDYPSKVASVLFLSGCNFHCPYCHNPKLVDVSAYTNMSIKRIANFLTNRKKIIDGVVLSGGEPTLQPGLIYLCEEIKNIGYSIKLDTNGSRPKVIRKLIDGGLVDYIAMDIKTDPLLYSPLLQDFCRPEDILLTIQLIMKSSIPYEFRTTCVKPFVSVNTIENILNLIAGAELYALQKFKDTGVLSPAFFGDENRMCNDYEINIFQKMAETMVKKCIIR